MRLAVFHRIQIYFLQIMTLWIILTSLHYKATAPKEGFLYRIHQNLSKNSDAPRYINAFYNYMNFLKNLKAGNSELTSTIEKYIPSYIEYYCRSLSHRLLKTPVEKRNGMTVSAFIIECKKYNDIISDKATSLSTLQFNIRLAKFIDSNLFLRKLYLLFRKIYNKPIYT